VEKSIPQLKEMLDAAEHGEFDVLVCFDLTRFRALGRQIADVLASLPSLGTWIETIVIGRNILPPSVALFGVSVD
jgi:hypothetical protein